MFRSFTDRISSKLFFVILFSVVTSCGFAQTDSTEKSLKISAYLETYYAFDFSNPSNHIRPPFIYSYNRHNEINANLGFVKLAYQTQTVRANLALATGTYMNANYYDEPGALKNLFEANAGIKVSGKKNIWIDAGVFASHIGAESAVGKDNWNLSRSILADNTPYYESGAKISYTSDDEKWFVSGLVLNGWQRIQRINGNNTPAFGHQITYKPNSKILFNSSSFAGSATPDSVRKMRYFHNFYGQFQLHKKWDVQFTFDIGVQQKSKGSSAYNNWYSSALITRYAATSQITVAARAEYYHDATGIIISTHTANGFQTYSYSFNIDYKIAPNIIWRIEGREYRSEDKIFTLYGQPSNNNYFVITSLAIDF
ncbi:MAG: porin [Bacteroidetes bacterium]|nr:porin [Bacteroidota bacterium]MBS1539314.1 porin [Bacteroidota bacterium]